MNLGVFIAKGMMHRLFKKINEKVKGQTFKKEILKISSIRNKLKRRSAQINFEKGNVPSAVYFKGTVRPHV